MTGAVTARDPEASRPLGTTDEDGLTANPFRIDQSLMLEIRYADWSEVKLGGYFESEATDVPIFSDRNLSIERLIFINVQYRLRLLPFG